MKQWQGFVTIIDQIPMHVWVKEILWLYACLEKATMCSISFNSNKWAFPMDFQGQQRMQQQCLLKHIVLFRHLAKFLICQQIKMSEQKNSTMHASKTKNGFNNAPKTKRILELIISCMHASWTEAFSEHITEHISDALKLTVDLMNMKCHHSWFYPVRHLKQFLQHKNEAMRNTLYQHFTQTTINNKSSHFSVGMVAHPSNSHRYWWKVCQGQLNLP